MSSSDRDPESVPPEVDAGLAYAFGGTVDEELPSVLARVADRAGRNVRIALRDAESADSEPLLRPLGPLDPRHSGKYVIHGELGRGGVGAVHRAHDQELGRDVALKFLLERYQDDPEIMRRFVEEAQIGGQLQHPGIVPVYDLGMARGRPFFAMKLVKGETLAKRLARRASPADDRHAFLSIFEAVCQTMAYAHARGVVHRDLKPANVMIGGFGEVQVVDWGVGKVLRQGGVDDERLGARGPAAASVVETVRSKDAGSRSVVGSVMGTPAYMPPEQARGQVEAMDERSDVFALGAILCEILTGQPPYVGQPDELVARAATADLEDAFARLAACGAEGQLVELAASCLQPAPSARPANAEAVAEGVRAYLARTEERVREARVEAAEARVRAAALKRVQTLGAALIVAVSAGLVASLWLWRRSEDAVANEKLAHAAALDSAEAAERNAGRAERELTRALEIKRLIQDMLQSVSPDLAILSDTTLMKGILDQAASRLERGAIEDELVAAELHQIVGDSYRTIGLYEDAGRHVPRALEIRERALGPRHDATLSALSSVAYLDYANGAYDAAEAGFREVLDRHDCPEGRACPVVCGALKVLASTLQFNGRGDEAEALYLELLGTLDQQPAEDPLETLQAQLGLGQLYIWSGRVEEADRVLRESLESSRAELGPDHPQTIRSKRALASLECSRGRYDPGLELFRECVEASELVFGPDHPETLLVMRELGAALIRAGRPDDAEAVLAETLSAHLRVHGKDHPATQSVEGNLAALYMEGGRFDEAESAYLELLETQEQTLGRDHPNTLVSLVNLAAIHHQRGRIEEAQALCEEVIEAQERVLGPEHPATLQSKWLAASILRAAHRFEEAEDLLLEVVEARRDVMGPDHPDTLLTLSLLAGIYENMGEFEEAARIHAQAAEAWTRVAGPRHPFALIERLHAGLSRMELGDEGATAAGTTELLEELEKVLGPNHQHTLVAVASVGSTFVRCGEHRAAVAVLEPRFERMRQVFGEADPRVTGATEDLERSYATLGRGPEALALATRRLADALARARERDDPEELNDTAWALLTDEREELRDPRVALELARRACELEAERGGPSLWIYLDTLALAQHCTGDTASAVATQRRALAAMPAGSDPSVAQRLAEYEAALDGD